MAMNKLYIFQLFLILSSQIFLGCSSNPMFKPNLNSRHEYLNRHGYIDPTIKDAILAGEVVKGMTKEQVKVVWGEPDLIENIGNSPGWYKDNEEGWYYKWDILSAANKYIFFVDGQLESIDYMYK